MRFLVAILLLLAFSPAWIPSASANELDPLLQQAKALGAPMANGYRQIHGHVIERLPIPHFSRNARTGIGEWMRGTMNTQPIGEPPWDIVYAALELSTSEQRIVRTNQA